MHTKFRSKQQLEIIEELKSNWLNSPTVIALIQGFSGTGKSSIADDISVASKLNPVFIDIPTDSNDYFSDFSADLLSEFERLGIDNLDTIICSKNISQLIKVLISVITSNCIAIIINDFQNIIEAKIPSKDFTLFFQQLNRHVKSRGKLLLVSSSIIQVSNWDYKIYKCELNGLTRTEAKDYFITHLSNENIRHKVSVDRIPEIVRRLGYNPRAIETFIESGLRYDSLEDIMTLSPELFQSGDAHISLELVKKLEEKLLARSLANFTREEVKFIQFLSVYRRHFDKKVISFIPVNIEKVELFRRTLIDRYIIKSTLQGDLLHPLMREVCVSKLKQTQHSPDWLKAQSLAADYNLSLFKTSEKINNIKLSNSYTELRHHLIESNRVDEIATASVKLARFLTSKITKDKQFEKPKNKSLLAERIALISSLPAEYRSKGLEYHLALCLKERHKDGDYQKALMHIKNAVHADSYYAAWNLLLELTYAVKDKQPMLDAFYTSINYINANNNVAEVYRCCSKLLKQAGDHPKATEIILEGINNSGAHTFTSLGPLGVQYLEENEQFEDAIILLKKCIADPQVTRVSVLYLSLAKILINQTKYEEAEKILVEALARPDISKIYLIKLKLAEVLEQQNKPFEAIEVLQEGIANTGKENPVELYHKYFELLIKSHQIDKAVEQLNNGIKSKPVKDPSKLIISLCNYFEENEKQSEAIVFFDNIIASQSDIKLEPIYKKYDDMLFKQENLSASIDVLNKAINDPSISNKHDFYKRCADRLERLGEITEAINKLKQGINDSNCQSTYSLYLDGSKIYTKHCQLGKAIALIKEGTENSAVGDKTTLFEQYAKLLAKNNDHPNSIEVLVDALKLKGIKAKPRLYKLCAELMMKNDKTSNDASKLLREAIANEKTGQITPLFQLYSDILVDQENYSQAKLILEKGLALRPKDKILKFALELVLVKVELQQFPEIKSYSSTFDETLDRLKYFQRKIECENGYKFIIEDNSSNRRSYEKKLQYLFKFVWANTESCVDAEVDNGRGSVDFKISRGERDKTLVEFKLASSSSLKNNIENQVQIYAAANNTDKYFTVIFYFNEAEKRKLDRILFQLGKLDDDRIFIIDASNKVSASKAKSN
ncbi:MAG: hypothetical protein OCD00_19295 [Colwellia sp.]